MTNLTSEELAIVAREVTGKPHKAIETPQGGLHIVSPNVDLIEGTGILRFPDLHSNEESYTWIPDFRGNERQRSQALAVVEWLSSCLWADYTNGVFSDNTDYNRRLYHAATARIAEHVYNKAIAALQRMVLELRNPK